MVRVGPFHGQEDDSLVDKHIDAVNSNNNPRYSFQALHVAGANAYKLWRYMAKTLRHLVNEDWV